MRELRALLLFRPVATTIVLVIVYGLGQGWLAWSAGGKLPAGLPARADVAIELAFAPESFHVTRLQDLGRVIRVEGQTVFVQDMRAEDVRRFARNYWVRAVRPWSGA